VNLTPAQLKGIEKILTMGYVEVRLLDPNTVKALIAKKICERVQLEQSGMWSRKTFSYIDALVFADPLPEKVDHMRILHILKT